MTIYALVDCNNFYVSCERVFNPLLENQPVAVLSNNDGCIISRSNEVKALQIPMGAPLFKCQRFLEEQKVTVLSSNYTLYGDLSQRVMDSLHKLSPCTEVYSIDEAFLTLDGLEHLDLTVYASDLRQKIKMWTGIPVSIGIAPTKTLAKVANHYAKKRTNAGVFDMRDPMISRRVLSALDVKEVWGIGQKLSERLKAMQITTAKQLKEANPKRIRKYFGVTVERTVLELQGISCLGLEAIAPKKSIVASRSFGNPVTTLNELQEAISNHVARACKRLRAQQSKAQALQVFIQTSAFKQEGFYQNSNICNLPFPTSDTSSIIKAAQKIVKDLFRPGYTYKKAGVMLENISSQNAQQEDLFGDAVTFTQRDKLMSLLDRINEEMGDQTLFWAAQGIESKRSWEMSSANRSPSYTSQWGDLPVAIA